MGYRVWPVWDYEYGVYHTGLWVWGIGYGTTGMSYGVYDMTVLVLVWGIKYEVLV